MVLFSSRRRDIEAVSGPHQRHVSVPRACVGAPVTRIDSTDSFRSGTVDNCSFAWQRRRRGCTCPACPRFGVRRPAASSWRATIRCGHRSGNGIPRPAGAVPCFSCIEPRRAAIPDCSIARPGFRPRRHPMPPTAALSTNLPGWGGIYTQLVVCGVEIAACFPPGVRPRGGGAGAPCSAASRRFSTHSRL